MNEPNLNERIKSAATPKTAGAMEEREAIYVGKGSCGCTLSASVDHRDDDNQSW